ncbi:MAG: multicopper oxidase domain-containing protein [Deltaproteobacteria bacterium]|nr:multicopper oxidase domain-containing protein [Deltaproteobacteria bacterium]
MAFGASTAFGNGNGCSPIPGGTLDPCSVPKYVTPMIIPPAMPPSKSLKNGDLYRIAVRQFPQQILPGGSYGPTTVWSYGSVDHPGTFNYPAFTIEANWNRRVSVEWRNELVDQDGNFLPHLLPVDPTLHWANPPGGKKGRDRRPTFTNTPSNYFGPVPIVTHVHGAHTSEESDGYPEAWYLPNAKDIPKEFATTGTFYDYFMQKYKTGWEPGTATFDYPNDQRATTLWYHDHTLGMTRLNVYAGPAGFYLIRGGPDDVVLDSRDGSDAILPGPAPGVVYNSPGSYGEIPIVVQDRSFNNDGSLFYPAERAFFDDFNGPFIPNSVVSPVWNPEFFGNMMVVNGVSWPFLSVEPKRYRLRLLNGCNSRFLILAFSDPNVEVYQIGAEGGFLPAPVKLNDYTYPGATPAGGATVLLSPAERADVIVDFSNVAGSVVKMTNLGPDEPFGGGEIGVAFDPADPATTGQVMQFIVSASTTAPDNSTPPEFLNLPSISSVGPFSNTQYVSLNEEVYVPADVPFAALLGTYDPSTVTSTVTSTPLLWSDPITENPEVGAVEQWEMANFTEDAHPIHIHQVQFEVIDREVIGGGTSVVGTNDPLPWETGFKDTVTVYPGEVARVKAKFDIPGFYVWHCHIVEHEDNEMMRPYHVGPIPKNAPAQ